MTLSIILIYLAEKNYTYSNLLDIKSGYRGLRVLPNKVHFVNKMRILLINNKYYTLYVHNMYIGLKSSVYAGFPQIKKFQPFSQISLFLKLKGLMYILYT